jgi:hypothetical protein
MNQRIVFLALSLVICFLIGGVLMVKDSAAQADPGWLSFDKVSGPASPELILLDHSPQSIELQTSLPGAHVETVWVGGQTFTRLSGEGYGFPTLTGHPELPVLRREVEIPFGAQIAIELVSAQYIDVSLAELGLHTIYPMQPSQIKLERTAALPFTLDVDAYTRGDFSPTNPLSVRQPYIVRGHRILPVEVWPVAYDPVAGTLRLYSQVTFRLRLEGADMILTGQMAQRYASSEFDRSLSQRVLNFNQGLDMLVIEAAGYLIITADAYYDAIQALAVLRASRGFEVTVTRLSELPGNTAQDIKNYIQTAYETWIVPPSYVLLVGDTNTIPTWEGPEIKTSTDLYYVTMDGAEDWHADIGRGRFPVRSAEQTTYMVDKYLAYANLTGVEPWLKTTSFPATCDLYEIAEGSHNYVIDTYTLPGGWTGDFPTDLNPGGDQLYCVTYGATNQDLIDAFDQGRWAIVYSGHGNYDGWEMGFDPVDVANLTNAGMFPFVASHSCLTGDFGEMEEVFGETWVLGDNQGALAFLGSSTYTYWNEDDTLERTYFDTLFSGVQPPPDLWMMTEAGLAGVEAAYPDMALYYRETYNLLGDPAIKLFLQPDLPTFTLSVAPTSHEVCVSGEVSSTVEIGSALGYAETVTLEIGVLPANVSASFDPANAAAPYTATFTLDVTPGTVDGDYSIEIIASDDSELTHTTPVDLRVVTSAPAQPTLVFPPDASFDQHLLPLFGWAAPTLIHSQLFQLADSALFETLPVYTPIESGTTYQLTTPLEGGRCYWWRVVASNACGIGEWSIPFHFATAALDVSFGDDIESGAGNWSHVAEDGKDNWAITTDQSHSPTHAWYVPDAEKITDTRLWNTTPVAIGPGETLSFWHRYQIEENFDGAVLEISTDGGGTWADLGPYITANGYTGTISTNYQNPLGGQEAWTGDRTEWTEVTVDLGSFTGQNINIRWRLGSDRMVGAKGWYIDDVRIASVLPLAPAPTLLSISEDHFPGDSAVEVIIAGTGFGGIPSLRVGDTWLEALTVVDENTISAIVPAGLLPGTYDLTLYNGDCQEAILADALTIDTIITFRTIYLPTIMKTEANTLLP